MPLMFYKVKESHMLVKTHLSAFIPRLGQLILSLRHLTNIVKLVSSSSITFHNVDRVEIPFCLKKKSC